MMEWYLCKEYELGDEFEYGDLTRRTRTGNKS